MSSLIEHWRAMLDHPILRLELRRIRRKRWWPGRRFFLFYPVLLGQTLFSGLGALGLAGLMPAAPEMGIVMVPGLASLAIALVEVGGAALLVGAAVWWLERM